MKRIVLGTTFASMLLGTTALAGPIDDIVSQFRGYGYDGIEIRQVGNMVRIEGQRGSTQREIVYDVSSSRIVSDETSNSGGDGGYTGSAGAGGVDSSNDSSSDDGHDDSNDDSNDDESDDSGNDDSGNDDHGGSDDHDDDSGGDDSGGDDNGDDDSGDDDSGDDD